MHFLRTFYALFALYPVYSHFYALFAHFLRTLRTLASLGNLYTVRTLTWRALQRRIFCALFTHFLRTFYALCALYPVYALCALFALWHGAHRIDAFFTHFLRTFCTLFTHFAHFTQFTRTLRTFYALFTHFCALFTHFYALCALWHGAHCIDAFFRRFLRTCYALFAHFLHLFTHFAHFTQFTRTLRTFWALFTYFAHFTQFRHFVHCSHTLRTLLCALYAYVPWLRRIVPWLRRSCSLTPTFLFYDSCSLTRSCVPWHRLRWCPNSRRPSLDSCRAPRGKGRLAVGPRQGFLGKKNGNQRLLTKPAKVRRTKNFAAFFWMKTTTKKVTQTRHRLIHRWVAAKTFCSPVNSQVRSGGRNPIMNMWFTMGSLVNMVDPSMKFWLNPESCKPFAHMLCKGHHWSRAVGLQLFLAKTTRCNIATQKLTITWCRIKYSRTKKKQKKHPERYTQARFWYATWKALDAQKWPTYQGRCSAKPQDLYDS